MRLAIERGSSGVPKSPCARPVERRQRGSAEEEQRSGDTYQGRAVGHSPDGGAVAGRNCHEVPGASCGPTHQEGRKPMRTSRLAGVLAAVGLAGRSLRLRRRQVRHSRPRPRRAATTHFVHADQEPQAGYQPIYRFISTATKTLDMTMYSLSDPKVDAALIADAKRGVAVRVLFDSDPTGGGGKPGNQAAYNDLKAQMASASPGHGPECCAPEEHRVRPHGGGCHELQPLCARLPGDARFCRDHHQPRRRVRCGGYVQRRFQQDRCPSDAGCRAPGSELIWSPGAQSGLVSLIGSARPGTTLYSEDEQLASPVIEQALVAAARRGSRSILPMTYSSSYVAAFKTLVAGGVHVNLYHARRRSTFMPRPSRSTTRPSM